MNIKFYKTDPDNAVTPTCAYDGTSAGYDIYSTERVKIPARGSALVPNGIRIEVPNGWYFTFDTRSSYGIRKNVICFRGVVDASYTGELAVKMFNLSDEDVYVEKGDKYAQIIFHRQTTIDFEEVYESDWLKICESSARGEKGFGSSGN